MKGKSSRLLLSLVFERFCLIHSIFPFLPFYPIFDHFLQILFVFRLCASLTCDDLERQEMKRKKKKKKRKSLNEKKPKKRNEKCPPLRKNNLILLAPRSKTEPRFILNLYFRIDGKPNLTRKRKEKKRKQEVGTFILTCLSRTMCSTE